MNNHTLEMIARTALICDGWVVAKTETRESYDIVARDPVSNEWKTFHVVTTMQSSPTNCEETTKPITLQADCLISVLDVKESKVPRVWLLENSVLSDNQWRELPLSIQREVTTKSKPNVIMVCAYCSDIIFDSTQALEVKRSEKYVHVNDCAELYATHVLPAT